MRLESCDIILYVNHRQDLISKLSRWAIGEYDHVSMYVGKAFHEIPFIYESSGRGARLVNLQEHTGRLVKIVRPKIYTETKGRIINQALNIASKDSSYYDYFAIVKSCLPRVLKTKFPWLPLPLNLGENFRYSNRVRRPYIRDSALICSEAVAEVFWRSGVDILPKDVIPLPGDFDSSPYVSAMEKGVLMFDIIP